LWKFYRHGLASKQWGNFSLGITGVPEEVPDEAEGDSSLPEAREVVESEPYSWLYPSEIAAFAVLVVLGGMYFWAWRERRRLAHTREPD
ncbi:MAG: hypothetical protein ACLFVK_02085, partial [Dehalococcoidia bacterium]